MWDYVSIEKEVREKASRYVDHDRDALLERVIALETQLYPIHYALSSILDTGLETHVTSKLFPDESESGSLQVYDPETKNFKDITVEEKDLATTPYLTMTSMVINDGASLGDEFEILDIHQTISACSVYCGGITAGDVRRIRKVLSETNQPKEPT